MATIAFCGLGMMGAQMAKRLRDAGHDLRVWNRSSNKAKEWATGGGTVCQTPQEAARGAQSVHCMLSDDAAVESTLFGNDGALKTLSKGALVVDHTTVSVAGTRERAAKVVSGGWHFIQAPVFAGPPQIAQGQGLMLIGGDPQIYEKAKTTLSQIVASHRVVGDRPEDAAAFKLMGNSMLVSINEGLAEFFAIAKASGIAPARAFSLFEAFDPSGTISRRGPRMVDGNYASPTFTLSMAEKDVRLMLQAAGNSSLLPALTVTEQKMKRLIEQGYGHLDMSALAADSVPPAKSGEGR